MRSKQKPAKGRKALALYRYRVPMQVREWVRLSGGADYPRCPRCACLVDREFMRFCDQCGQRLGWRQEASKIVVSC